MASDRATLTVTAREQFGSRASRRLRRDGKVPGIVYGGKDQPLVIELDHNALMLQLRKEAIHSSILTLVVDGSKQQVLLRAVNMHPWRQQVQHVDFQRVLADQKIHMKVPLHFVNAEIAVAVKLGGATSACPSRRGSRPASSLPR